MTNETKVTKGYHNLLVWQRARELVKLVYKLTSDFPKSEDYGLTSQIRRFDQKDYNVLENLRGEVAFLLNRFVKSVK